MNEYEMFHQSRIVQETLREDYGVSAESAFFVQEMLYGAARQLQANGYEVSEFHILHGDVQGSQEIVLRAGGKSIRFLVPA